MEVGAYSHIGKVRDLNEDAYYIPENDFNLFVIADGMGGHNAGEVASHIAIDAIKDYLSENLKQMEMISEEYIYRILKESMTYANRLIYTKSLEDEKFQGMGTTLTVMLVLSKVYIGHVGDSRAYLIKNDQILQITQDEKITALIPFNKDDDYKYFFMATEKGVIKKTKIEDFDNVRRSGLVAIKLDKGDELKWVHPVTGKDEIILTTSAGQAIHFKETDVRSMGRGATGVRGIRLKDNDIVVGMDSILPQQKGNQLLVISENGFGKRTDLKHYKIQKRGGSGIKTAKVTSKTGKIVSAHLINVDNLEEDLIATSQIGQIIRMPLNSISTSGRDTQGVRVMRLQAKDKVSATTLL